ncbi:MAG: ribosome small subunit-dependent GTPase A [Actinobacteria bacterium HGW-Actinobacteria-7]|nr:MAG: ribosome small subunit-dependent GTPase A [Actinobacteria bacterium HGW-Actinobacteria-7]
MPLVATAAGLERAEPATHLVKTAGKSMSRAVVGDWVAIARPDGHDMPIIEAILPRHSSFARKDPSEEGGEQVLIANVDIVFVVQSLSGSGINVSRLERELVLAWESGAQPVVVLTKDDLSDDTSAQQRIAEEVAFGADVIVESAVNGVGIDEVLAHVPLGVTAALLGSSGVGKSTLVNRLVGEELQETGSVREGDDKGRHVTVARELVLVPGGGVIIDTPGMRAVALWEAASGMVAAFPEIEALAEHCRFRDCKHEDEPGCAVVAATIAGDLPQRRLDSYRKLTDELALLARRQDEKVWREKEQANKTISKAAKRFYKSEPKRMGR